MRPPDFQPEPDFTGYTLTRGTYSLFIGHGKNTNLINAFYQILYFLIVKSEGSKYSLSLIVAWFILRQTYQVNGTDIRGVTVKERKAKASHPNKVAGLCLHPTKKAIIRKKPIMNKISSYVIFIAS